MCSADVPILCARIKLISDSRGASNPMRMGELRNGVGSLKDIRDESSVTVMMSEVNKSSSREGDVLVFPTSSTPFCLME